MVGAENKSRHKFGILDFLIVIFAAALIAGAVWFFFGRDAVAKVSETPITYIVELNNVSEEVKDSPQVGDILIDAIGKAVIGTIESVEVYPQKVEVYNELTKEITLNDRPGKYRLVLICSAQAQVTDAQITVNAYRIAVGRAMFIHSKNLAGTGYCIAVNEG